MTWQSGKSGNPGGRPKLDKFITQHLIAELKEIDPLTQAPRLRKVIKALIIKAEEGDIPAIKEIMDRTEGRVPQEQQIDGNVGITIGIVRYFDPLQVETTTLSGGMLEGPGGREETSN